MPYAVLDASAWGIAGLETDGQTEHVWLHRPGDDRPWLFKSVTSHGDWHQGEDWTERLASAIAEVLGIPHATVELARREGSRGCLVRDVKEHQWQWYAGSDLLAGLHGPAFDPRDRHASGHNLSAVAEVLKGYSAPSTASAMTAFECFSAYLMLDAVIANQDRHSRNWAVMIPPAGSPAVGTLAPTFDHASGLAFGLRDEERSRWLLDLGVDAWARRRSAKSFEHGDKPWPTLVDVAVEALAGCSPPVQAHWLAQLALLVDPLVTRLVDNLPGLSDVTANFTRALICINRDRLLERLS